MQERSITTGLSLRFCFLLGSTVDIVVNDNCLAADFDIVCGVIEDIRNKKQVLLVMAELYVKRNVNGFTLVDKTQVEEEKINIYCRDWR